MPENDATAAGLPQGASADPDGETNTAIANEPKWKALRALNYRPGATGLPEGATAAEVTPAMNAAWKGYFKHTTVMDAPLRVGSGGWLTRTSEDEAVYANDGIVIYGLTRTTNLNWLAHQDPAIAAEWAKPEEQGGFGFTPVPLD